MSDPPRIVPATVTPLSEGGERLLLDWIPQHLAYLEHRGADGVLALGTNGEGVSLSLQERKEVIDAVITHRGRLYLMFGTGCASLPETIDLSRYAVERGADAVLIVPPFYFKDLDPEGLLAYYEDVLSALPPERKAILYNIPETSGVEISEELVDALIERFPERLLGIKDTSGRPERTRRYVERYPQLDIYNGSDANIGKAVRAGVVGTISGIANVVPDLVANVFSAHASGGDVMAAQAEVDRARRAVRPLPPQSAIKHLLHLVAGLPLTYVRPPLRDLTPDEIDALERQVRELALA
jgi:4-hydroxy-tetrahydrodipicolinate synthase